MNLNSSAFDFTYQTMCTRLESMWSNWFRRHFACERFEVFGKICSNCLVLGTKSVEIFWKIYRQSNKIGKWKSLKIKLKRCSQSGNRMYILVELQSRKSPAFGNSTWCIPLYPCHDFSHVILSKIESTAVSKSTHGLNTIIFHSRGGNGTTLVSIVEISPIPVRICWFLIYLCSCEQKREKKVIFGPKLQLLAEFLNLPLTVLLLITRWICGNFDTRQTTIMLVLRKFFTCRLIESIIMTRDNKTVWTANGV